MIIPPVFTECHFSAWALGTYRRQQTTDKPITQLSKVIRIWVTEGKGDGGQDGAGGGPRLQGDLGTKIGRKGVNGSGAAWGRGRNAQRAGLCLACSTTNVASVIVWDEQGGRWHGGQVVWGSVDCRGGGSLPVSLPACWSLGTQRHDSGPWRGLEFSLAGPWVGLGNPPLGLSQKVSLTLRLSLTKGQAGWRPLNSWSRGKPSGEPWKSSSDLRPTTKLNPMRECSGAILAYLTLGEVFPLLFHLTEPFSPVQTTPSHEERAKPPSSTAF